MESTMKLPACELADVPRVKIVDYLLSPVHPAGRGKAAFFRRVGFSPKAWAVLADALKGHAAKNDVRKREDSPFGTRYTVEGPLRSPDGRDPAVRSVWFVEKDGTEPRLVTAYPLPRTRS